MSTVISTTQALAKAATADSPHRSLSLGISQNGQTETHHFGHNHLPHDQSLYEIGSLTKVFTAILLAKLSQNGTVNLDDTVADLLNLPHFPQAITLRSLSTHHSGLPRLPRNLLWSILKNPANPYLNYSQTQLYKFLNHYKHSKRIGQFEYSNLAVGLLGHILETVTQTPYLQLIQQHITQPLGMADTTIQLSPEQQQRLIPGYLPGKKARPAANWDLPAIPGCGALRSSITDLLTFATANLQAETEQTNPLAAAMALSHQPQQSNIQPDRKPDTDLSPAPTQKLAIGLGWFIRPLPHSNAILHWHDGGTGGYQSSFALHLPSQTAVIVLANCPPVQSSKDFSSTAMGDKILHHLLSP